ncbi:MAG: YceI family protein, partial [Chitinophagaceae bacterium]
VAGESKITFKIKNLGFNTNGSFSGITGKINFDETKPAESSMEVSIPAKTVNTDNNKRDNHLRSDDYFDVKNYPDIRFVSTSITAGNKKGEYVVKGKLTIKKTTKEISIPFTATASTGGFRFSGEFSINRRDFGVGGGSTISDNLDVQLDVVTKRS